MTAMKKETLCERVERKANEHSDICKSIYDIEDISGCFKQSYMIGAIEILRDFANELTEIIDEEEKNLDTYHFSRKEQERLLESMRRIRDRISNALEEIGMVSVDTLQND